MGRKVFLFKRQHDNIEGIRTNPLDSHIEQRLVHWTSLKRPAIRDRKMQWFADQETKESKWRSDVMYKDIIKWNTQIEFLTMT